jgi:hypothetical protein
MDKRPANARPVVVTWEWMKRRHMRVDPDSLITTMRSVLDSSHGDIEGPAVRRDPIAEAITEWLSTAQPGTPRRSAWRHVVAALIYDSQQHRQIAGARSFLMQQRRLLFEAAGVEIDLEVDQSQIAGRLRMLGQVTANDPDLTQAWVIAEGASGHLESEVDEVGQFSLDGLVSGPHRLEIGLAYELIEIPSVQL